MDVGARPRTDLLIPASILFVLANAAHTIDHFRQGTGRLSSVVLAGGTLISVAALFVLYLALRRDPRAATVAAIVGFTSAVGISASHLAPHWSILSDSYPDLGVDAAAWLIVSIEIGAGSFLGYAGVKALRRENASA